MVRAFEARGYDVQIFYLHSLTLHGLKYVRRVIALYQELAQARYVFLEDASNVVSAVSLRPETVVAQLWHGCGAFKKFGFSTSELLFGGSRKEKTKYPYYKNLDLVTISAPEVAWAYAEAMGLEDTPEIIVPTGISRTDVFFEEDFLYAARKTVENVVPQAKEKKIILYAPTFRGMVDNAKAPDRLDIIAMQKAIGEECILLCKHHPYVKVRPEIPEEARAFAFDVSETLDIDSLLCVADVCISDYSSLVFEYALFGRPMVFFAYDLDEYCDWRGFYYDYDQLTPGPVVQTNEALIAYIKSVLEVFDDRQIQAFRTRFMGACDGHATERILELVLSKG